LRPPVKWCYFAMAAPPPPPPKPRIKVIGGGRPRNDGSEESSPKDTQPQTLAAHAGTGATRASRGHRPGNGHASYDRWSNPRLTWPSKPLAPRVATVAATTTKVDRATAIANGALRDRHRCQKA
jgi:hypothetical protein